ncbi:sulfotransferase family protein [Croceimicrobium hydrocarbonivorans]|uniref:Sulfotransferase n=1 Tax=Croceimicrobium hydrocarbonivorans TaxID=2761580 RepID=A0A7H0VC38_9FLAO|nr:sulfotransferase [Croceimicrobium hydrocarbonivorans]QNR23286.1 sulfotransferase [Croceimicrobium hydrocarbonivorans]
MRPPFIIIGMHRSGTSILTKVLEKSGIFMGVVKDHNYEAMHFLSINQQVLWKSGADWHKPKVPEKLHWHEIPAQELFREHFRLNGRLAQWRQALRHEKWGWKDPRNTFTLDMWLAKFPGAKVIHLLRNEDDVVASLQKRNEVNGEVFAPELKDQDYCHQLCQDYVKQGRSYAQKLGDRYLELEYEKLRAQDPASIEALQKFTGLALKANFKKYLH